MREPRIHPQRFRWDGTAMVPLSPLTAARQYVEGEVYRLAPPVERSRESHRLYFAAVTEAWEQLDDARRARFPSPEHLRKTALIRVGYYDERVIVCASAAEAERVAALIKPLDEFAIIETSGRVVRVYTAKSQSESAMGRATFEDSKQKVLDLLAEMIGVDPVTLVLNAGRAA